MNEKCRFAIQRAGEVSLQALAYLVLLSLPASAGDPLHKLLGCPVPDCIGKWCRDDYCTKKEPRVCVPLCFGCNNYCGKNVPCVCAPLSFCCDDYCKKCPPKVYSFPLCQLLRCGSSCQGRACENCNKLPCDAYAAKRFEVKKRSNAEDNVQLVDEQLPVQPQRRAPVIVRASDIKLTK